MAKLEGFGPYNNQERMAVAFKLPKVGGGTVALWDFKQRQALVLVFLPQATQADFAWLEETAQVVKAAGAQLLVSLAMPIEDIQRAKLTQNLSFPVLADRGGQIYRKYLTLADQPNPPGELPAALFVADRFGAISRYALADSTATLPNDTEIAAMLEFLGNLCNP